MKLMYPYNYASAIVATTENADFPVTNLDDDYVGNLWKATAAVATLTVTCSAGATAIAIFNTNATSITVRISGWDAIDWEEDASRDIDWGVDAGRTINWVAFGTGVQSTVYDISASQVGNLWAEFAISGGLACTLWITLTGSANIYAGVLRAGIARSFRDPTYGIPEGLRDYSIRKELNSGGFYTRKRNSAREFSFEIFETRANAYSFLYDYAQVVGPTPIPWRIVHSGNTDWEWIVFASFDGLPAGSHDHKDFSNIEVNLIESI